MVTSPIFSGYAAGIPCFLMPGSPNRKKRKLKLAKGHWLVNSLDVTSLGAMGLATVEGATAVAPMSSVVRSSKGRLLSLRVRFLSALPAF